MSYQQEIVMELLFIVAPGIQIVLEKTLLQSINQSINQSVSQLQLQFYYCSL